MHAARRADLGKSFRICIVAVMSEAVIVGGARTPIGRLLGSLSDFSAADLGGIAIKAALDRAGVAADRVDYVIMGQVLQAGAGQIPSRQAAVAAGIPMTVPSLTINKVCLSGLDAIALAAQLIRAGEFDVVVAGGMESMTQAPHLLPGSRKGFKYGSVELIDAMAHDGLTDAFDHVSMGESTERHNAKLGIGRVEQDEFAARSHQLAAMAIKNGLLAEEIVPVPVPQRRGDPVIFDTDEGVRADTSAEGLGRLRPSFAADGTITAGSASQISDGACAVVVMSAAAAAAAGATVLAEVGAHGVVAGPDNSLHSQPSRAISRALAKAGLSVSDLDLIEINEAFAAVAIQSMRDLRVSPDIVNVNGGAIALGHPIGMSGARLALTLAYELRRRGGGLGAAALCGGGGQGDALLLRVPAASAGPSSA
jgi:acetyl-CoA C-acetyltransferase